VGAPDIRDPPATAVYVAPSCGSGGAASPRSPECRTGGSPLCVRCPAHIVPPASR